ncbi:hypothetical protein IWX90DRAFT_425868 [Phyllosticta citrichinensis]|uniref:Uncharacterized protein n=1 Tax=Phyllosticta citrichinensis TaxID=1130410 RepID=A0ABR1Y4Q5_9PEZI
MALYEYQGRLRAKSTSSLSFFSRPAAMEIFPLADNGSLRTPSFSSFQFPASPSLCHCLECPSSRDPRPGSSRPEARSRSREHRAPVDYLGRRGGRCSVTPKAPEGALNVSFACRGNGPSQAFFFPLPDDPFCARLPARTGPGAHRAAQERVRPGHTHDHQTSHCPTLRPWSRTGLHAARRPTMPLAHLHCPSLALTNLRVLTAFPVGIFTRRYSPARGLLSRESLSPRTTTTKHTYISWRAPHFSPSTVTSPRWASILDHTNRVPSNTSSFPIRQLWPT